MNYPKAFIAYLLEFHCSRDYFECHEILEEYWKEAPSNQRNPVWVGFIQLAVSLYHYRRENRPGALKSLNKAEKIFKEQRLQVDALGIETNDLFQIISKLKADMNNGKDYKSIHLPIKDSKLLDFCNTESKDSNLIWGSISDLNNHDLINRHKTRDRAGIIEERNKQLNKRHASVDHQPGN